RRAGCASPDGGAPSTTVRSRSIGGCSSGAGTTSGEGCQPAPAGPLVLDARGHCRSSLSLPHVPSQGRLVQCLAGGARRSAVVAWSCSPFPFVAPPLHFPSGASSADLWCSSARRRHRPDPCSPLSPPPDESP